MPIDQRSTDGLSTSPQLDVVILGVPKAGTSSLFDALAAHPAIEGSEPKETFFFLDRAHPLFNANRPTLANEGHDAIAAYFNKNQEKVLKLEGTTHNIYSSAALDHFSHNGNARFLVSLREPASRIQSLFHYVRDHQCNLDSSVSFSGYVDHILADDIASLKRWFFNASGYFALANALDHSNYPKWLREWAFAGDRLMVVLFEQFRVEPREVLKYIAHELDLEPGFLRHIHLRHGEPHPSGEMASAPSGRTGSGESRANIFGAPRVEAILPHHSVPRVSARQRLGKG